MISQTYGELASVRLDVSTPADTSGHGRLKATELGALPVVTAASDPIQVRHPTRRIDGVADDHLNVCVQDSGRFVIDPNGNQVALQPTSFPSSSVRTFCRHLDRCWASPSPTFRV
ncbi:hypothetical protein Sfulv_58830 [Streptomyces fulvorobeus]|uniref:Uncharacterized protein n=1 Tax=Streptomyces fulvorobeus TaxID=284028 RepID=A0A7J0CEZ4_9ACTN|nr:hypothetical protein Sfulv_58830 [Streptomyces fulvorobeus]